ncbi:hypothetical protein QTP88_012516 [Uroleucon formosanum]
MTSKGCGSPHFENFIDDTGISYQIDKSRVYARASKIGRYEREDASMKKLFFFFSLSYSAIGLPIKIIEQNRMDGMAVIQIEKS